MSEFFRKYAQSTADRIILALSTAAAIYLYGQVFNWRLPSDIPLLVVWGALSYLAHRLIVAFAAVLFVVSIALSKGEESDNAEIDYYSNYDKA